MNNLFNIQPNQFTNIYQTFRINNRGKEKIHMTLEPLQSIIQIALLSVSPVGTKLAIYENILYLQIPSLVQPFSRWYHSDKKDDLYFLFQVIKRFTKWYNPKISQISPIDNNLYQLLLNMAKKGLDKLIQTYQTTESLSIVQVIQMYQDILFNNSDNSSDSESHKHERTINIINKKDSTNLDEIFEKIIQIYDTKLINIIYNTLSIIYEEQNEMNITNYIQGLNFIMNKSNDSIKFWIKTNLVA